MSFWNDFKEFLEVRDEFYEYVAHERIRQLVRQEAQEAQQVLAEDALRRCSVEHTHSSYAPLKVKDIAGIYYDEIKYKHGDVDQYRREQAAKLPGYNREESTNRLLTTIANGDAWRKRNDSVSKRIQLVTIRTTEEKAS